MMLMAEAMVEQGYAVKWHRNMSERSYYLSVGKVGGDCGRYISEEKVDPFSDSLSGYRQRRSLARYLVSKQAELWSRSYEEAPFASGYAFVDNRVKWCFEQLAGESDE